MEQLGRKCCQYLSTIDLRDAFHTLHLKNILELHHIINHLHTTTLEWVWV